MSSANAGAANITTLDPPNGYRCKPAATSASPTGATATIAMPRSFLHKTKPPISANGVKSCPSGLKQYRTTSLVEKNAQPGADHGRDQFGNAFVQQPTISA